MMITVEIAILTFMIGFVIGVAVKGNIDRKFDKKVQESLIRVGQMADDEIEDKNVEIERLKMELASLREIDA